jgi:ornithine carbamoyltransferase
MDLHAHTMNSRRLHGRSLLKEIDLTADEFLYLVDLGDRARRAKQMGFRQHRLAGRNIALIFEKASTRTRSAFEVAAYDEGAHVTYIGPDESQLGAASRLSRSPRRCSSRRNRSSSSRRQTACTRSRRSWWPRSE